MSYNPISEAQVATNTAAIAASDSSSAEQNLGTITWTGGVAPSGAEVKIYKWSKSSKTVMIQWRITEAVAGVGISLAAFDLPGDCPAPYSPTGLADGDLVSVGDCTISASAGDGSFVNSGCGLKWTSGRFVIDCYATNVAATNCIGSLTYLCT